MKYIRTKYGIYDIENSEDHFFTGLRRKFPFAIDYEANPQDCKTADTIEELGDCFIAIDKNGNLCENPMIAKGHCFKSFCNYYKANGIEVDCYLAILTDKGLIYVAKMNEEGELELL